MGKRSKTTVSNFPVIEQKEDIVEYTGSVDVQSSGSKKAVKDANSFFKAYVSTRMPVVLNDHIKDLDWKGKLWSNKYLKSKCGSASVRVEWRKDKNDRFGKGNEKTMLFSSFLDMIDNNDENVYLTTQELSYNSDGQPAIISPPLTQLRSDFPLIPSLFQHLVVSNINMWFGSSTLSTTSGLHHDFHDNLYLLLRGEKTFTLYSPREAPNMYTVGEITRVHSNGRINYKDQPTRADGADLHADAALSAAMRMERAASRLEKVRPPNSYNKLCVTPSQLIRRRPTRRPCRLRSRRRPSWRWTAPWRPCSTRRWAAGRKMTTRFASIL